MSLLIGQWYRNAAWAVSNGGGSYKQGPHVGCIPSSSLSGAAQRETGVLHPWQKKLTGCT